MISQKNKDKHHGIQTHAQLSKEKESHLWVCKAPFLPVFSTHWIVPRVYQLWRSPHRPSGKGYISYNLVGAEASLVYTLWRMGRIWLYPKEASSQSWCWMPRLEANIWFLINGILPAISVNNGHHSPQRLQPPAGGELVSTKETNAGCEVRIKDMMSVSPDGSIFRYMWNH